MTLTAAVAPLAAQVYLYEDWSEYALGTNVATDSGSPWYQSSGSPGGSFTADVIDSGGKRVMNTRPGKLEGGDANDNYILVGRAFTPVSGDVTVEVDVKVVSGGARIFLSSGTSPFSSSLEVRFALPSSGTLTAYDGTLTSAGARNFGSYSANEWYRVTINMSIDSSNGSLSKYSVFVTEIASGNIVGSIDDLSFNGIPTSIGYITIGSALSAAANAEWGRIEISQIPEQSTAALIAGSTALLLCLYRRRMRRA